MTDVIQTSRVYRWHINISNSYDLFTYMHKSRTLCHALFCTVGKINQTVNTEWVKQMYKLFALRREYFLFLSVLLTLCSDVLVVEKNTVAFVPSLFADACCLWPHFKMECQVVEGDWWRMWALTCTGHRRRGTESINGVIVSEKRRADVIAMCAGGIILYKPAMQTV